MKEILLENTGNKAKIDDDDYELVVSFGKWYESDGGYAIKKTRVSGKNVSIRMHTLINNTPKNLVTDHINGDRLDNRKGNLRSVTQAINAWNSNRNPNRKYDLPKGVSYDKSRDKYVGTRTLRRRFDTKEEAIKFTQESEMLYARD